MPPSPKTPVKIIFGAMTFGREGVEQAHVYTIPECSAILDIYQSHGHGEVDTARLYGEGTSELFLGELDWRKRGLVMDTKYYPISDKVAFKTDAPAGGWKHTPEHLRTNLENSLRALKADKVDMWYLHGPDRSTPFETTMRAVNDLHKEGKFDRFGLSNFQAWEVAQICETCQRNGWVMPSVYQGVYNALFRSVEPELFPCLRHYGVSFYGFNPLVGGYLTDRYHRGDGEGDVEEGSRFDPKRYMGKMYRKRYWNEEYFDALDVLRPVAKKYGLKESECALRWVAYHSLLKKECGDGIIIGASSTKHIESNLVDLEKGPLPDEVVKALDEASEKTKIRSLVYWH